MALRWSNVVVDCTDPVRLGRWWAEVLGYTITYEAAEEVCLRSPAADVPELIFIPVPDAKTVKNRLHLDLRPDDREAEVERLVDMGARRVDVGQASDAVWTVLADPEGNEFCVLRTT